MNYLLVKYFLMLKALVTQSCLTLFDPIDCSLPGSTIPGIFQAGILAWSVLPVPSPENLPDQGIEPGSLALQADALPSELPRKGLSCSC